LEEDAAATSGAPPVAKDKKAKAAAKAAAKEAARAAAKGDAAGAAAAAAAADDGKSYPRVVEPSVGVDRLFFALLADAWRIETLPGAAPASDAVSEAAAEASAADASSAAAEANTRTVLGLHHSLSPVKVAVLPVRGNDAAQSALAKQLHQTLLPHCAAVMDTTGSIGKRYRRQDEIGTPWAITVDGESTATQTVTVRCRDSMKQVRLPLTQVMETLQANKPLQVPL